MDQGFSSPLLYWSAWCELGSFLNMSAAIDDGKPDAGLGRPRGVWGKQKRRALSRGIEVARSLRWRPDARKSQRKRYEKNQNLQKKKNVWGARMREPKARADGSHRKDAKTVGCEDGCCARAASSEAAAVGVFR